MEGGGLRQVSFSVADSLIESKRKMGVTTRMKKLNMHVKLSKCKQTFFLVLKFTLNDLLH